MSEDITPHPASVNLKLREILDRSSHTSADVEMLLKIEGMFLQIWDTTVEELSNPDQDPDTPTEEAIAALAGFEGFCRLYQQVVLAVGESLKVEVDPIVELFNLAKAEAKSGHDITGVIHQVGPRAQTAWAKLRRNAEKKLDYEKRRSELGEKQIDPEVMSALTAILQSGLSTPILYRQALPSAAELEGIPKPDDWKQRLIELHDTMHPGANDPAIVAEFMAGATREERLAIRASQKDKNRGIEATLDRCLKDYRRDKKKGL